MDGSKALLYSSKLPWPHETTSLKFIDNLGMHHQNGSPALIYGIRIIMAADLKCNYT
jgi:hypothetical protein